MRPERAKLPGDITPHVMRHTFASRLAMAGVDLRTIQELGRWEDIRMVQRYANLSRAHIREALDRIGRNQSVATPLARPVS